MSTVALEGTGAAIVFESSAFEADLLSISLSEIARESIDTTHLGTQGARTCKPGQAVDYGTVDLLFDAAPGSVNLVGSQEETITISYPDDPDEPTLLLLQGYVVKQGAQEMRIDRRMVTKMTIRLVSRAIIIGGQPAVPVFGLLDVSQFSSVIVDRLQSYDAAWGRRFYNELTGGRSFITGGTGGGSFAAYQVDDADPALRHLIFSAETTAGGDGYAGSFYGLDGHDLDTSRVINSTAIQTDIVDAQNLVWEKVRVRCLSQTPSAETRLRIEIKDATGSGFLYVSPQLDVPTSEGWLEWWVPPITGAKFLFVILSSPTAIGVATVKVTAIKAAVRIGSQMLPGQAMDAAALFSGGTGGANSSILLGTEPAFYWHQLTAESSGSGTTFAGAEWTGVGSIATWTGVRLLLRATGAGTGQMRIELKDSGGALVWASAYADVVTGSMDFAIPSGLVGVDRLLVVMASPLTFTTATVVVSGVHVLVAAQDQRRPLCDLALAASYGQMRRAFNVSTGMSRDNVSYNAGEFDSVPATGFQALCAAMMADLGFISGAAADALIVASVAALDAAPRHASGILPHWLLYGARHPGSEWSTVDTALALFSALVGAQMRGLSAEVATIEAMLDGIDGASLRNGAGAVTMGYDGTGAILPYVWESYGGELILADMMACWTDPDGHPDSPPSLYADPPVYRKRGFIQEISGLIFSCAGRLFICRDRHGANWSKERHRLWRDQQARWPAAPYGVSSGEIIRYDGINKERPEYFGPDLDPLLDTYGDSGPWVMPHYMSMVADIDTRADAHVRTMLTAGIWNLWGGPAEAVSKDATAYVHRIQIALNAFFHTAGWYHACKRYRGESLTAEDDPVHVAAMARPKMAAVLRIWFPDLPDVEAPTPLLQIDAGAGPTGLATVYNQFMPTGSVDATFQLFITMNQAIVADPASTATNGCSLTAGPTLDSGDTRCVWTFDLDDDFAQVAVYGVPPAAAPWASSPGGTYPDPSTTFNVSLWILAPLDPIDPVVNTGDPLTLQPAVLPSFLESDVGTVEWYKDGSPTGVTSWQYPIASASAGDAGSYEPWLNGASWSSLGLGPATVVTVNP